MDIKFDATQLTEKELIDAANDIFKAEECDFNKIKSEKWYQKLFHALTFNQDGKKYVVRDIKSLAKLQQLFMSLYVDNYRKSHEQLNRVIQAIIEQNITIKRLYGTCVLKLEKPIMPSELNSDDAKILALFLGEYKNSDGIIPERVQKYNKAVLLSMNCSVPNGRLDGHQLQKLEKPQVIYRCFMEQCAIDGTIESQDWSDEIYYHLDDINLGTRIKREIKDAVKREAEIAGIDYLIDKYKESRDAIQYEDLIVDRSTAEAIAIDQEENNANFTRINDSGTSETIDLLDSHTLEQVVHKYQKQWIQGNQLKAESFFTSEDGEIYYLLKDLFSVEYTHPKREEKLVWVARFYNVLARAVSHDPEIGKKYYRAEIINAKTIEEAYNCGGTCKCVVSATGRAPWGVLNRNPLKEAAWGAIHCYLIEGSQILNDKTIISTGYIKRLIPIGKMVLAEKWNDYIKTMVDVPSAIKELFILDEIAHCRYEKLSN